MLIVLLVLDEYAHYKPSLLCLTIVISIIHCIDYIPLAERLAGVDSTISVFSSNLNSSRPSHKRALRRFPQFELLSYLKAHSWDSCFEAVLLIAFYSNQHRFYYSLHTHVFT